MFDEWEQASSVAGPGTRPPLFSAHTERVVRAGRPQRPTPQLSGIWTELNGRWRSRGPVSPRRRHRGTACPEDDPVTLGCWGLAVKDP